MRSKRALVLAAASLLFLLVLAAGVLTLIADSESTRDLPQGSQTAASSDASEPMPGDASASTRSEGTDPTTAVRIDENSGEVKAALPMFHSVDPDYMRGASPARGGMEVLRKLGVKTLVDLRSTYDRTPATAAEAEQMGLQYYCLPLNVWDPPTEAQTAEFLRVVTDKSRTPVFVFCVDGVNRTGEMTAIYRMSHAGWSAEQALKEMDDAGFSPYHYSLRNYVWAYARTHRPR